MSAFTRITLHAENPDQTITEVLYNLLSSLCCSYSTGILYKEVPVSTTAIGIAATATAGNTGSSYHSSKNPLVMRVIRELKPAEDQLHERLVLAILNTCSPLKREYAPYCHFSVDLTAN